VQLQQGFATGEMGFNDKFAPQKILNSLAEPFRCRPGGLRPVDLPFFRASWPQC
jgi:hypothetical protein